MTHRNREEDYLRCNPPQGLGDIDLSDYKKEATISAIADAWLMSPEGKKVVDRARVVLEDRAKAVSQVSIFI